MIGREGMRGDMLLLRLSAAAAGALAALLSAPAPLSAEDSNQLLYGTEGNRLRRTDVDTIGSDRLAEEVFVERASAAEEGGGSSGGPGRDVNGMICFFLDGSGRFVLGEDTGQPDPPAGWGVFDAQGLQIGKLTATYFAATPEPYGCAFDPAKGALYTTSVGDPGFGPDNGQLIRWFEPYDRFVPPPGSIPPDPEARTNFCKLAIDIGTAAGVAVDAQGRVWVASSSGLRVDRFTLPAGKSLEPGVAGEGCETLDPSGAFIVDDDAGVVRETLITPTVDDPGTMEDETNFMFTFTGLAIRPDNGNLYAASVITGRIAEYDVETGAFVRWIVTHDEPGFGGGWSLPQPFGTPQGITVAPDGTVYYADLDLMGSLPDIDTGPDGKVWRVRMDAAGDPLTPEIVRDDLAFPDGVAVAPGNIQKTEWLTLAGGPERQFSNPDESTITADNVAQLTPRWSVPTGGSITTGATVAAIDIPGAGLTQVVFQQAWDLEIYAVRLDDGSVLWRFPTEDQPGSSFPATASVHVAKLDNRDTVFVGQGHLFYSIDAVTGEENWRFTAGTGCRDEFGEPPGLCGFDGERNQIESSAFLVDGRLFFGMDVNDVPTGKGGFFAVDARTGTLDWFFDLESGATCRPLESDEIRRYDGYHSEEELGLPPGFFATRPGCDHPRTPNGCGNVWSSPAVDLERHALFLGSSNCDTPVDPVTMIPEAMPPFDEAIVSLDVDGNVRWVWRPREFDNEDLAFGGVPNLFHIERTIDGVPTRIPVVGIGGKDGSYYVLDRDGMNQENGAAWDDDPASHLPADLPYWVTNVVAGGDVGGVIATAAVDEVERRVHFSTAIGVGGEDTQTPTVHTLDLDTGAVLWQASDVPSFGSTSLVPGVVFTGRIFRAGLFSWRADDGAALDELDVLPGNVAVASAPTVVDGTLVVGAGIGTRTQTGSDPGDVVANLPSAIGAFCVPGTSGCAACNDGVDNDGDTLVDAAEDDGCVDDQDHSEVLGDTNYDHVLDGRDAARVLDAFARQTGQAGYVKAADLDPPGAPDGIVGLVDWQRWLAAVQAANPPPPGCGLLGIEPLLVLAVAGIVRRRRAAARRRPGLRALLPLALLAGLLGAPLPASALVSLRFEPDPGTTVVEGEVQVAVGGSFVVDVLGDLSEPIVGFGFDVDHDTSLLLQEETEIGPDWFAVASADGDGLAGAAFLPGVSGPDVLLATITFTGLETGLTALSLGITEGDPTEGFALVTPGEFDLVEFGEDLPVRVIPEPATAVLLLLGLVATATRRRR